MLHAIVEASPCPLKMLDLVLTSLVGLCLGLLGSVGSIVTLPVLVYVARVPAHQAVGMSLVIVGATSAVRRAGGE